MSTPKFALLVLKTADTQLLREFYEMLGFEFQEEQHGGGPVHFAAKLGDGVFEIYPLTGDDERADATTRLGFTVAGLDRTMQRIQDEGATVLKPAAETKWGRRAVVRDPDGRSVELYG